MEKKAIMEPNDDWKATFPDGQKISEIFYRQYRNAATNNSAAAFSTYQGEGDEGNTQPKGKSKDQGKTDKDQSSARKPNCFCSRKHWF